MKKIELPKDEIKEKYLSGMSSRELAGFYSVSESRMLKELKKMGITRSISDAKKACYEQGKQKPTAYWTGKKISPELIEKRVEKLRGENHWLWKGGKAKRDYRKVVKKEKCDNCGSVENLGIHHKDGDHYNNSPDNLQVLCVICFLASFTYHRRIVIIRDTLDK